MSDGVGRCYRWLRGLREIFARSPAMRDARCAGREISRRLQKRISMALNVAVQMDPIDRINIAGDSTFALLLEARARGHRLSYYTPDKRSLRGGRVVAGTAPVEVRDVAGDHFTLGGTRATDLASFEVVLLRQDPPFDLAYITSSICSQGS